MMCSMMTGSGFDMGIMGSFGMAWLGLVLLFFIVAFARKYIGEGMGIPFSFIGAIVLGIVAYVLIVTITCSYKIAILVGIIGAGIGAYFGGQMSGGGY